MPTATTSTKATTPPKTDTPPVIDLSKVDWAKTGSDVLNIVQTAKQFIDAGNSKQPPTAQGTTTVVQRPSTSSPKNPMAEVEEANGTAEQIRKENEQSTAPIGKMPMSLKIALALVSGCAAAFGTHLVIDKQPQTGATANVVALAPAPRNPAPAPPQSAVPLADSGIQKAKIAPAPKATTKKTGAKTPPPPQTAPVQPLAPQAGVQPQTRRTAVLAGAGVGTALATFTALHFLA
jgi:hypothetical protein